MGGGFGGALLPLVRRWLRVPTASGSCWFADGCGPRRRAVGAGSPMTAGSGGER